MPQHNLQAAPDQPTSSSSPRRTPNTGNKLSAIGYVGKMTLTPEKTEAMLRAAQRFEGGKFLPNVADIREFCRIHGVDLGKSVSRASSIPRVFTFLATMDTAQITKLLYEGAFSGPTRLAPIADAIRNRSTRRRRGLTSYTSLPRHADVIVEEQEQEQTGHTPSQYEQFVASLYYAVQKAEDLTTNLKNLRFELNKKITNNYGIDREFDVYWEYTVDGGDVQRAAIECKNYSSNITVEKMDALVGKLGDLPYVVTPIFATRTGYQSGARAAANHHKVELLIVREQNISDWTDGNGQPLVRYIDIEMNLIVPASIHRFEPQIDANWTRANTDIVTSKPLHLSAMNNEIVIEDEQRKERFSLQELAGRLRGPDGSEYGRFQEKKIFDTLISSIQNTVD